MYITCKSRVYLAGYQLYRLCFNHSNKERKRFDEAPPDDQGRESHERRAERARSAPRDLQGDQQHGRQTAEQPPLDAPPEEEVIGMSNLRDLATYLYRTGKGRQLIGALDLILEEKNQQGEKVFEEFGLFTGEVSAAEQAVLEKNAS